ncbi:MAG TPA: MFS transporter [Thermomicrobiales bacterium]|nr:MFS transporter [Thermomicrobiales bacterium]
MRGHAPGRADPNGETIGELVNRWLPPGDLRRLVAVRGLRSFTQGYIMVVFSIYLGLIGFPAWLIGVTLTLGGLASADLTLLTGVLSDRVGRRIFLLIYSVLLLISGLLFSLTTVPWVLIVISALGGLGRGGGGGGAGAFAPAEQAMIAEKAAGETRRRVFGVNTVVGTLGGAVGALLAGVPQWLRGAYHLSLLDSYRPLYLSVALVGVVSFVVLWPLTEAPRRPRADDPGARARRKRTRATIGKISFAGAINGFGMGFIAGIVPYWLHVRYGVSAGAVGPIMTVSSLLTSGASLVAVRLAMRYGDVALITGSRLVTAALTLALPFAPVYPLAAVLYGARRVTQMMAMPVRMSYTMGIVEAESRGSAAGMNGVSMRLPASVSPSISGYWIGLDELGLPFFAAGFFAAVNAVLYWVWFRRVRPLDEPAPERPAAAPPAPDRPAATAHSATHPAADK